MVQLNFGRNAEKCVFSSRLDTRLAGPLAFINSGAGLKSTVANKTNQQRLSRKASADHIKHCFVNEGSGTPWCWERCRGAVILHLPPARTFTARILSVSTLFEESGRHFWCVKLVLARPDEVGTIHPCKKSTACKKTHIAAQICSSNSFFAQFSILGCAFLKN